MTIRNILMEKANANEIDGIGFKTLTSADFNGDKVQFSLYRDTLDEYHKMLYISTRTTAKDKALLKVLETLDFTEEEAKAVKEDNLHQFLIQVCTKKSKVKTDFGKELLAELKEEKESLLADTKISESAREAGLKDLKERRNAVLYNTNGVWEPVKLAKVSETSFREAFELVLARTMLGLETNSEYGETRLEKRLNNKWRKLKDKATLAGIDSDTFEKYHGKRDADGLRALIKGEKKPTPDKKAK